MIEQITQQDILNIDSRIKSVYVEERETENSDFFVQIKFHFQYTEDGRTVEGSDICIGRHEFSASLKECLLVAVKNFTQSEQHGWTIIR